jgi:hypothetical protein
VGPIDFTLDFSTTYLLIYTGIFATLIALLFARRKKIATVSRLAWTGHGGDDVLFRGNHQWEAELAAVLNRHVLRLAERYTKPRDIQGIPEETDSPYHDKDEMDIFHSIIPLAFKIAHQGKKFVEGLLLQLRYGVFRFERVQKHSIRACLESILIDYDYCVKRKPPMHIDLAEDFQVKISFVHLKYIILHLLRFSSSSEQLKELQVYLSKEGKIHIKLVGASFSSELLEHLFDFFPEEQYRVLADFDLAVSKLMIETFGGRITYYSRASVDPYTEFIVELPVCEASPSDAKQQSYGNVRLWPSIQD